MPKMLRQVPEERGREIPLPSPRDNSEVVPGIGGCRIRIN